MTVKSFFDLHEGVTFKEDKWYLLPTKCLSVWRVVAHPSYVFARCEGGGEKRKINSDIREGGNLDWYSVYYLKKSQN